MKQVFILLVCIATLSSCGSKLQYGSKPNYEVIPDDRAKVLRGIIDRNVLESDTSFKWFKENMKYGTADASAIASFAKNKAKFNVVVFGGTWCEDSQNLLPVFYRLVDKSGFPENQILLLAADRKKTTVNNLHEKFKVKNVPTFIIMHDGKEIGRVVEYGKYAAIDKELGEIVANIQ